MGKLSYYDIFGVMAPGAALLAGLLLVLGDLDAASLVEEVSIGGLGVFAIIAYPAGQLVQAIGNILEKVYWHFWSGAPTDWVRTGKYEKLPLSKAQFDELRATYASKLGLSAEDPLCDLSQGAWRGITSQVYTAVDTAGRGERVIIFNSNYGFHRGLAVALLTIAVAAAIDGEWVVACLAGGGGAVALYRMHRFGRHYARELFAEFLQLPGERKGK